MLSYQDEPFLINAVRSVLDQDVPVEVVVVNSGGGDPAGRLAAAGLRVPVHNFPQRLYPGAVRNVGIDHTRAPTLPFSPRIASPPRAGLPRACVSTARVRPRSRAP